MRHENMNPKGISVRTGVQAGGMPDNHNAVVVRSATQPESPLNHNAVVVRSAAQPESPLNHNTVVVRASDKPKLIVES